MTYTHAIFQAGYGASAVRIRCRPEDVANMTEIEPTDSRGYRFKLVAVSENGREQFAHVRYADGRPVGFVTLAEAVTGGQYVGPDAFALGIQPPPPAPKFKPGDRVYFLYGVDKREREYATVVRAEGLGYWLNVGCFIFEHLLHPDDRTAAKPDQEPAPKFKRGDWVYWLNGDKMRFGIVTRVNGERVYFIRNYSLGGTLCFGTEGHEREAHLRPANPDDAWISWAGGDCPVPGEAWVEAELRTGSRLSAPAEHFLWKHDYGDGNIVRYRAALPRK